MLPAANSLSHAQSACQLTLSDSLCSPSPLSGGAREVLRKKSFEKNKFTAHLRNADIYPIVSQQKWYVRVAFRQKSDGLRKGKMRESKERRKTWFPSLFCPLHKRLCKLKDVNTVYLLPPSRASHAPPPPNRRRQTSSGASRHLPLEKGKALVRRSN